MKKCYAGVLPLDHLPLLSFFISFLPTIHLAVLLLLLILRSAPPGSLAGSSPMLLPRLLSSSMVTNLTTLSVDLGRMAMSYLLQRVVPRAAEQGV